MSSKIRFALDLSPLLVFFLAYRVAGLLPATMTLILATLLSLAITYHLERRIAIMPLLSGIIVAVFGALTLYLQDETFIKMKPTIINLLFAALLLGGLCCQKPMFKYLLGGSFDLDDKGWQKLSLRWGLFFIFLAALNEFIWRHYSTNFWVNFKVFGMFTLTMAFTFSQIPLIKRHWIQEETDNDSV